MRKVSELVLDEIRNEPLVEVGLSLGIINLTSLARNLRPKIEKRNLKKTSIGAIAMALQRLGQKLKSRKLLTSKLPAVSNITVHSKLIEFTFNNSSRSPEFYEKAYKVISNEKEDKFFNLTQGIFETTLIVSNALGSEIKKILPKSSVIINNLSAVTIRFEEETVHIPGVYYQILKVLAWEGINLVEVVSVSNELSLVFENSKVDRAFSVIKGLVEAN